jgi:hypothetical protein
MPETLTAPEAPAKEEKKRGRDKRVDYCGLVDLLKKKFADPLKAKLKEAAESRGLDILEGDLYDGKITGGGTSYRIDTQRFIALCRKKKISKAKIDAALRVNGKDAESLLSGDEIESISVAAGMIDKSFTAVLKKGVNVSLTDAIEGIAAELAREKQEKEAAQAA